MKMRGFEVFLNSFHKSGQFPPQSPANGVVTVAKNPNDSMVRYRKRVVTLAGQSPEIARSCESLLGSPLKALAKQWILAIPFCSFVKFRAAKCREPVQAKSSR